MSDPKQRDRRESGRGVVVAAAVATVFVVGLMLSSLPLGVSGEWTWARQDGTVRTLPDLGMTLPTIAHAGLFLAIVAASLAGVEWIARRLAASASPATGPALWAFAFLTIHLSTVAVGAPYGHTRGPHVVLFPQYTGYYAAAVNDNRSFGQWWADYDRDVAKGDVLHQGTHPPGLVAGFRILDTAVRRLPLLAGLSRNLRLPSTEGALAALAEASPQLDAEGEAVLHLATLLTLACAAACVWPISVLLRPSLPREWAARWASLWAIVPAVLIFLPKSDCVLPLIALLVAVAWRRALHERSMSWGAAAGGLSLVGLLLSLGVLPVYAGLVLATAPNLVRERNGRPFIGGMIGVATPILLASLTGLNLIAVWSANLRNHAGFYDKYPRTALAWLPVNFVEGVVAFGAPLVFAAAFVAVGRLRFKRREPRERSVRTTVEGFVVGVLGVWVGLWLSGKNMGEAARLWIVLDPWLLIACALVVREVPHRQWCVLAGLTAIASAACVLTVDGFGLLTSPVPLPD